jgi:DNA-binding PadR family transcriptional regulator
VKRDLCATKESQIGYEILAYLADHPDSGDTLEGIVEWWLLERKIKRQTANVREALTELVAKGWVLEYKGRDARTYYRLNRRKHEEIRALLRQ